MSEINYNTNLDTLLGELSTPKQDFTPKPPVGTGQSRPGASPTPGLFPEPEPGQPIPDMRTPEQIAADNAASERSGERMAKTIDGIVSFAACMIAKEQNREKYKATPGDIDDLAGAWSQVSAEYHFNFSPWFNVVFLSISVYVPIFMKATNDRRYNTLMQKHDELQRRIEDLEKEATKERSPQ